MMFKNFEPDNRIFLAPMAGITDRPFRKLCRMQGAGLTYTEMVSAKALHYEDAATLRLLRIDPIESPCAVQIFGHEPELIAEACARLSEWPDIALIDLNMGCPAPKIVNNGDGSALMKKPELVRQIIRAAVGASGKPVTVKTRKGWDESSVNVLEIADIAAEEGAAAITVHGRTREQMYAGVADWAIIREVKRRMPIPVIGNGDVRSRADAVRLFEETGCDALMIGRAAQGNPWIFRELAGVGPSRAAASSFRFRAVVADAADGAGLPEAEEKEPTLVKIHADNPPEGGYDSVARPSAAEWLETVLLHYRWMIGEKGVNAAIPEMRKHAASYLHGIPGAARTRAAVFQATDMGDVKELLRAAAGRMEGDEAARA